MKHKKGYFKGKYSSYLLAAYSSYQKSTEPITNKQLAKELGISVRSLYYIKSGKQGKRSKAAVKVKEEITKHLVRANHLTEKGRVIFKTVERIRRNEKKKKGIKELSQKEMRKIKKESKSKIEIEVEDLFEAHYEGDSLTVEEATQ